MTTGGGGERQSLLFIREKRKQKVDQLGRKKKSDPHLPLGHRKARIPKYPVVRGGKKKRKRTPLALYSFVREGGRGSACRGVGAKKKGESSTKKVSDRHSKRGL